MKGGIIVTLTGLTEYLPVFTSTKPRGSRRQSCCRWASCSAEHPIWVTIIPHLIFVFHSIWPARRYLWLRRWTSLPDSVFNFPVDLPIALFGHHMCRIGQTKKVLVFGGDKSSLWDFYIQNFFILWLQLFLNRNFKLMGGSLKNPALGLSDQTWLYDFDRQSIIWNK